MIKSMRLIRLTLIFVLAASSSAFVQAQTAPNSGAASYPSPDWAANLAAKVSAEVTKAVAQAESRAAVQVTTMGAALTGGGATVIGAPLFRHHHQ